MRLSPSRVLACAVLLAAGCAAAQREARLRAALDAQGLSRPLAEVWPAALRLLDERGFDLGSDDGVSIGKAPLGTVSQLLSQARDTRTVKGGRWVAETDLDGSDVRYRVEGTELGGGSCRVIFFKIAGTLEGRDEREHRDVELELELARRVDPAAAARLSDAAR
ncbi:MULTISPECIES: hypothetical protein [Anaeromyxobacter]|uniref:hypothetical protein n=1 Tax=Anaeromyxobacter TaxID=161492 RepID=UPI001F5AC472|nr:MULTISPECIES: hypothetical protein [unclassified Anaeromyxobacter]